MTALSLSRLGPRTRRRAGAQPVEYNLLLTATLCLLAFGVVMVFSASSTTALLGQSGDSAYYLKRTLLIGAIGLGVMRLFAARGLRVLRPITPLLLVCSFLGLLAVLVPGVGASANGASRWIAVGSFQIQPSELAKLALVLYGAHLLAVRPPMVRSIRTLAPYLSVVGLACLLMVAEPDLGTAIVVCLATAALLVAAGMKIRQLMLIAGAIGVVVLLAIVIEPYRMQRLTGFLNPTGDPSGAGFQAIQAKIALGSGGIFGVGLGQSLQKAFYLPEAHTDMIAAVIGEELGLVGHLGAGGAVRAVRLRRAANRAAGPGSLRQAARRRAHLAGPRAGDRQPVRGARPGAADRGAAAVRLLRQLEPAGDAGGDRPAPERGPRRDRGRPGAARRGRCETAGDRRRARASRRQPRERSASRSDRSRDSRRRNRGTRGAGAGRRRRASG